MTIIARTRRIQARPVRAQRGVALVVALILLVVATLIGLTASRSTLLQERMSANMYDRSLAFQRSEAALRAAEQAISGDWRIANLKGVDCSPESTVLCTMVPATAFTGTSGNWVSVDAKQNINDAKTPSTPQYTVQFMGTGKGENELGLQANADYGNYGSPYPPDDVAYYRVTGRSADPTNADSADRSIVVIQTTVRRAY